LTVLLIASPATAQQVQYYEVPKGDHPHDVAPAPDGTVWYTGQRAGVLGRLDPNTGDVKRVPLGEGSAPHGVVIGPDGAAWVTDSGLNAIVRVDAKTHAVKAGRCRGGAKAPTSTLPPSTERAHLVHRPGAASTGVSTRDRHHAGGMRRAGAAPTASPPRPQATSGSSRSRAATSPSPTLGRASLPRSIPRKRAAARAASGRIRPAGPGSANGTPVR
jgi:hypothetical protein